MTVVFTTRSSAAAQPPLLVADNGLPAAVRNGAGRYFAWIDSRGGVGGRRIVFRATTPGEQPLAVLTQAGAPEPVPQLVLSGSAAARGRSWAVGYVPGYRLGASVLARQIAKTRPGASIAVLYSDDADGRELLEWFRRLARVAVAFFCLRRACFEHASGLPASTLGRPERLT